MLGLQHGLVVRVGGGGGSFVCRGVGGGSFVQGRVRVGAASSAGEWGGGGGGERGNFVCRAGGRGTSSQEEGGA